MHFCNVLKFSFILLINFLMLQPSLYSPTPPKKDSESLLNIEMENLQNNSTAQISRRFTLSLLNSGESLLESETDFEKIIDPEPKFNFSYFFEFLGKQIKSFSYLPFLLSPPFPLFLLLLLPLLFLSIFLSEKA